MRGAAGRGQLASQPRPTYLGGLIATRNDVPVNASTTMQASSPISVNRGDVILFKLTTGTFRLVGNGLSSTNNGGGAAIAWNAAAAVDIRPSSGACPMMMWAGTITSPGTLQPTAQFASTDTSSSSLTSIAMTFERYGNARIDPVPRTGTQLVQTSTPNPNPGPWSSTYVPTHSQSIFTYMVSDFNASNGTPITYLNSSTELHNYYFANVVGMWSAWQPAFHVGQSQAFGVSAPAGQRVTAQGIEIKPLNS